MTGSDGASPRRAGYPIFLFRCASSLLSPSSLLAPQRTALTHIMPTPAFLCVGGHLVRWSSLCSARVSQHSSVRHNAQTRKWWSAVGGGRKRQKVGSIAPDRIRSERVSTGRVRLRRAEADQPRPVLTSWTYPGARQSSPSSGTGASRTEGCA
eukprot:783840-Prymnesium_polylepis.1